MEVVVSQIKRNKKGEVLKIGVEKLNYISREDRRREIRREKEEEFQREEGKDNERD